ncbi:MAG TPA: hypothetical protein VK927_04485, partial [Adhaeribacter sp.]|nr:hypothetical protein [Adhaeribacter sp.]
MKNKLQNTNNIFSSLFLLLAVLFATPAMSQTNGSGGNPCNTSQPRPITGNQNPCPGTLETYCIDNDRGYTSFVWDVPRAHAGNPPTGWEIVSGQGTNCVTVRVGTKSGTMKVTVNDPICGTKVATLPVKPAKGFLVDVAGPDTVCVNQNQTFTAQVYDSLGNGNGNGNVKGNFAYNWSVPAGWTIVSGQGTQSITATPGATNGQVSVAVTHTPYGNGNNGNGVGGNKAYCNTNAADGLDVFVDQNCGTNPPCPITATIAGPDSLCLFSDDPFIFSVDAINGATYNWTVTNATISAGQGTNTVEVMANVDAGPGSISVLITTDCGSATFNKPFTVVEDCDLINPLPVELLSFTGTA